MQLQENITNWDWTSEILLTLNSHRRIKLRGRKQVPN
jgi:hypothetical protein